MRWRKDIKNKIHAQLIGAIDLTVNPIFIKYMLEDKLDEYEKENQQLREALQNICSLVESKELEDCYECKFVKICKGKEE